MSIQERFRTRYFGPQGIIEGIRVCLGLEHTGSALGLVCAAVESMAFLCLPDERDFVSDLDFVRWVDKYLQPARIGVDGAELWKFRCALLSDGVSQRAVHSGKPRETLFAWGRYSVSSGLELRAGSKWHRVMMIYADELYKAIFRGAEEFSADFVMRSENAYLVGNRLNQIFGTARPQSPTA